LTKGKGKSDISKLGAWDKTLLNAKIGDCNIVEYTSIFPKNVKFRDFRNELIPGQETKSAFAVCFGKRSELITAGLAYGFTDKCGLITEFAGNYDKNYVKGQLKKQLEEMGKTRNLEIKNIKIETETLEVKQNFGCVMVAMVYNPNTYE